MTFEEALIVLKNGGAVRLPSWGDGEFIKFSVPYIEGKPKILEVHSHGEIYPFTSCDNELFRGDWEDIRVGDYLLSHVELQKELKSLALDIVGHERGQLDTVVAALGRSLSRFAAFRVTEMTEHEIEGLSSTEGKP